MESAVCALWAIPAAAMTDSSADEPPSAASSWENYGSALEVACCASAATEEAMRCAQLVKRCWRRISGQREAPAVYAFVVSSEVSRGPQVRGGA